MAVEPNQGAVVGAKAGADQVMARFAPRAAKARAVRIRIDIFIST